MDVASLVLLVLSVMGIGLYMVVGTTTEDKLIGKEYKRITKHPSMVWWVIPILFGFLFILFGSFVSVPAGFRGVLLRFEKVEGILNEGLNMKMPLIDNVKMMSVQTQLYKEDASAASKDLQDVKTTVAINYKVEPQYLAEIYRTLGVNYIERIAAPAVQETVKEIAARYNAEDMILRRASVKDDITKALSLRLRERGITTETVNITNFEFSVEFTKAIESKVSALQAVLESQNKLERVKVEAQQAQAQAEGEANAAIARAKGQAEAVEILKASLTPAYLQYIYIDKLAKDAKVIVVPAGMPLTISQ
jgi:regulator of protease activity HflC (stomatin/prohibitin superfamily)